MIRPEFATLSLASLYAASLLATACSTHATPDSDPPGKSAGSTTQVVDEPSPAELSAELARVLEPDHRALERFASNEDLAEYLAKHRATERRDVGGAEGFADEAADAAVAQSAPAPPMEAEAQAGPASAEDSITNNQEAGVDEGGIVKTHGDHLVVLRRGRLFTVDVADANLRPVSMIDVSPSKGHDAWYDEMLVHGDTIVVVGFSYQVGATELGLFRIDDRGQLSRKDTMFLRSNDYYSSRNYASRLSGDQLVFYMPYYLGYGFDPEHPNLPGVATWNARRGRADDWDAVIDGSRIHRPVNPTSNPVLHTVVRCDLSKNRFSCDADGILGPAGRSFYVSRDAVYVWTHEGWWQEQEEAGTAPAAVYRLPLDGGSIGALRTWGAPVDQFSFKQSADGHLNVLVRADAKGDAMWSPEFAGGDIGMMRVPVAAFDRGVSTVSAAAFVDLPEPESNGGYAFQNRFVGDHLLYGVGSSWGDASNQGKGEVWAYRFASGTGRSESVSLPHGVDRIEALGSHAVVVGSDGRNLHFSALELTERPAPAGSYVQRNASQGELRSHGFFFRPTGADDGMLGLPVRHASEPGYSHLVHGSAEILFLEVEDLNFSRLGSLGSGRSAGTDDRCETSCVDWYGNARPIFYRDRVFALLGYELVEGEIDGRGLREVARADMLDLVRGPRRGRPIWKAG